MDCSVVVPSLDGREQLAGCLDALAERAPGVEIVVVNGPSTDGTAGMVRDRADVDALVQVADRNVNAARNAGIDESSGDAVAFLDRNVTVEDGWLEALRDGLTEAPVATGPTRQQLAAGLATESVERDAVAGRPVTYFNPGNVAVERDVLDEADGFDEHLRVGGARDLAHRIAGLDYHVTWRDGMAVRSEYGADGGLAAEDRGEFYWSRTYSLTKNYGPRPTVARRVGGAAAREGFDAFRGVLAGEGRPSSWLGTGWHVVSALTGGSADGLLARRRDRTSRRNPYGRSSRTDRVVEVYHPD